MHQNVPVFNPNPKGQSLLEVVVLIGLALVIVTGLTIVTVNGLKNSQYSQNQAQATRLAKDAIDKVRTMSDQNCPVAVGAGPTYYYWYDNSSLIWPVRLSNTNTYRFQQGFNCGPAQPSGTILVSQPANTPDNSIPTPLQGTFRRFITIDDFSANQKRVNVRVEWTDLSGQHKSDLTTIIGQN